MEKARQANMPKDNIERGIKKGTGEGAAGTYEEAVYEGYGPGGTAIYVEVTAADAKRGKIFTKLIREIATAASIGGGDPDANPRLRLAVEK